MRILHVVESTVAGVRTHVQALATGLDRRQFSCAVACPPRRREAFGDERFVHVLQSAGVPVFPVGMRREISPAADAAALARLVQIIRNGQFDLIHLHSSKAGILGRLAARLCGHRAVVYSPHGLAFLGDHGPRKRQLFLQLERAAAHLCDRIIAVSPGERDTLIANRIAPPERIACINLGVNPQPLPAGYDRAAQRAALGLPLDAPVIGTVARVSAQKNPLLFVETAARTLREVPQAQFVWCGDGELRGKAEERARALGIERQVRFLGHREDAAAVLATFDLFWLTSNYESFGLATAEAMALERPVIATDVVGTRDVVVHGVTGLLVPPRDPDALARATTDLLADPQRMAAYGRAGRVRVLEHFTIDCMLRMTAQLYTSLVPPQRAEPAEYPAPL